MLSPFLRSVLASSRHGACDSILEYVQYAADGFCIAVGKMDEVWGIFTLPAFHCRGAWKKYLLVNYHNMFTSIVSTVPWATGYKNCLLLDIGLT